MKRKAMVSIWLIIVLIGSAIVGKALFNHKEDLEKLGGFECIVSYSGVIIVREENVERPGGFPEFSTKAVNGKVEVYDFDGIVCTWRENEM